MVYFNPRQTQNGLPLLILGSAKKERIFGVGMAATKACRKGGGGAMRGIDGVGFGYGERERKEAGRRRRERINRGFGVIERENGGMRESESNGVKVYLFY